MAILKFGAIVTEGSGSLGGHTIQNSQGGAQLRTKPIPSGNPSTSQYLIRSINQQLQAGWRALTPSQQKIWNDWPTVHGIMNAKGDPHPLSGHSLWMKYQYSRLIVDLPFLSDPSKYLSTYFGPELITNGDFSSSVGWGFYGSAFSISGGNLIAVNADNNSFIYRLINSIPNGMCRLKLLVNSFIKDLLSVYINNFNLVPNSNGTFQLDKVITPGEYRIYIQGNISFTGSLDYISFKQIYNY
jgi:hypothetical protein